MMTSADFRKTKVRTLGQNLVRVRVRVRVRVKLYYGSMEYSNHLLASALAARAV